MSNWTGTPLEQLFASTQDLYRRFNFTPSFINARKGLIEEAHEAANELLAGDTHPQAYLEELADLIVVGFSGMLTHGFVLEDLDDAIRKVIEKNDAKNHDTHTVYNNKITRRSKIVNEEIDTGIDCLFGQLHICNADNCQCQQK